MELRERGWLHTVERDPFSEILLSGLAVVAILLAADQGATTPRWLDLDPALSAMCFVLAFQRIRRARQVEEASSHAWDEVSTVWGNNARGVDAVLEATYQLGLHVLPFSSISITIFLPVLLLTEMSTIGHQVLFLRSHQTYFERRGYAEEPRTAVRELYAWRLRVLVQRVALATALTALAWSFDLSWRWSGLAMGLGLALLGSIVFEPFAAARRGADTAVGVDIQPVNDPSEVPDHERTRLDDVFSRAFPEAGVTGQELVERTGTDGHHLLVARREGDPVGLLAYQRDPDGVAYLWWVATDQRHRRNGIARDLLVVARKRLADCSVILLEADLTSGAPDTRAPRNALVSSLRAAQVPGLQWGPQRASSLYSVFVVPMPSSVDTAQLRDALTRMAQFSLRHDPDARETAAEAVARVDLSRITAT